MKFTNVFPKGTFGLNMAIRLKEAFWAVTLGRSKMIQQKQKKLWTTRSGEKNAYTES